MRVLASAVLLAEALVVLFATLVAQSLSSVPASTAWALGASLSVACLVVGALLPRRWAFVVGSLLQGVVLAAGFVVPLMFVMGVIFGALWAAALGFGSRAERIRAERAGEHRDRAAPSTDAQ